MINMKKFIFKTNATMKEYNNKKWWIDRDIVRDIEEDCYIEISNNAMKTKQAMYVDTIKGTKQIGYVITGKCDFEDRDNYRWSSQYIDLWVKITESIDVEF